MPPDFNQEVRVIANTVDYGYYPFGSTLKLPVSGGSEINDLSIRGITEEDFNNLSVNNNAWAIDDKLYKNGLATFKIYRGPILPPDDVTIFYNNVNIITLYYE